MRKLIFVVLLLSLLLCISCSIPDGFSRRSPDKNSSPAASNDHSTAEQPSRPSSGTTSDTVSGEATESSPGQKTHTETFLIGGNNAQGTTVVLSVPENWKTHDSMQDTLISDNGCEARFECVEKAPNHTDVYFQGEEGDLHNIIESGDLDISGRTGRYYYFQREHDDGRKEDKVRFYVFHHDFVAIILFTPTSGTDVKTQLKEFEGYLATVELG